MTTMTRVVAKMIQLWMYFGDDENWLGSMVSGQ